MTASSRFPRPPCLVVVVAALVPSPRSTAATPLSRCLRAASNAACIAAVAPVPPARRRADALRCHVGWTLRGRRLVCCWAVIGMCRRVRGRRPAVSSRRIDEHACLLPAADVEADANAARFRVNVAEHAACTLTSSVLPLFPATDQKLTMLTKSAPAASPRPRPPPSVQRPHPAGPSALVRFATESHNHEGSREGKVSFRTPFFFFLVPDSRVRGGFPWPARRPRRATACRLRCMQGCGLVGMQAPGQGRGARARDACATFPAFGGGGGGILVWFVCLGGLWLLWIPEMWVRDRRALGGIAVDRDFCLRKADG